MKLHALAIALGFGPCLLWAESPLSQAQQFFAEGDYRQAVELYQQLLSEAQADDGTVSTESGRTSDAHRASADIQSLQYNLAVCYYKLQEWAEASRRFRDLHRQYPDNDLVTYNLAVTEKKLGHRERAQALFATLAEKSSAGELSSLAKRQLAYLGSSPVREGEWLLSLNLQYGNDDNVVDPVDTAGSERDDRFVETLVSASWYSDPNDRYRSWVVDGGGFFSRYQQVDEYDVDLLYAGAKKYFSRGDGYWLLGSRAETSQLAGDDYLRTLAVHLATGSSFEQSATGGQRSWHLRYRWQSISSLAAQYDQLAGSSHRLEAEYAGQGHRGWRWKLRYRLDSEDRDDLVSGDDFYSYSALRQGLLVQSSLTQGSWQWGAGAEFRTSDYRDDHRIDGVSERRRDDRLRLHVRGERSLGPNWSLSAEYSYTDNHSTLAQYEYDRSLLMLGVGWYF